MERERGRLPCSAEHTHTHTHTHMHPQALAKQSGCYFLNVTASSIMSKWLGDASRLVRAVFTLAQKLQPCIIFIGETWEPGGLGSMLRRPCCLLTPTV
jgi:hypothetical protein